jgi:hypothetical protein
MKGLNLLSLPLEIEEEESKQPTTWWNSRGAKICLSCAPLIFCIPLIVYVIRVWVIYASISRQADPNTSKNVIQVHGYNLVHDCQGQLDFLINASYLLDSPWSVQVGKTTLSIYGKDGKRLIMNTEFKLDHEGVIFGRTPAGKEQHHTEFKIKTTVEDQDKILQILRQITRETRASDLSSNPPVVPTSVRIEFETMLSFPSVPGLAITAEAEISPIDFPLDVKKPKTACEKCRGARARTKRVAPPLIRGPSTKVSLQNVDVNSISAKAFDVGVQFLIDNVVLSGPDFEWGLDVLVGTNDLKLAQVHTGINSGRVVAKTKITTVENEGPLKELIKTFEHATLAEEADYLLPITIKGCSSSAANTNRKCFLQRMLEAINIRTAITFSGLQQYQNRTLSQLFAQSPQPACFSGKSCTPPKPNVSPNRRNTSGSAELDIGSIVNCIPNKISWPSSLRPNNATLRFTFAQSTLDKCLQFPLKGVENITAPLVMKEKHSNTQLMLSVHTAASGQSSSFTTHVDLTFLFNMTAVATSADIGLYTYLANGTAFDAVFSLGDDNGNMILARLLSFVHFYQHFHSQTDGVLASVLAPVLDTSLGVLNAPYFTVGGSIATVYSRSFEVPSVINDIIPDFDLGTMKMALQDYVGNDLFTVSLLGDIQKPFMKTIIHGKVILEIHNQALSSNGRKVWADVLLSQRSAATFVFRHRGTDIRFRWKIPGGLLGSTATSSVFSSPRVNATIFSLASSPHGCSMQCKGHIDVRNMLPFLTKYFDSYSPFDASQNNILCFSLKDRQTLKGYEIGCKNMSMFSIAFAEARTLSIAMNTTINGGADNVACNELRSLYAASGYQWDSFDVNFVVNTKLNVGPGLDLHPASFIGPSKVKYEVPVGAQQRDALRLQPGTVNFVEPNAAHGTSEKILLMSPSRWDPNDRAFGQVDMSTLPSPTISIGFHGFGIIFSIVLFILGLLLSICMCVSAAKECGPYASVIFYCNRRKKRGSDSTYAMVRMALSPMSVPPPPPPLELYDKPPPPPPSLNIL